jgi:hypothetical protein
VSRLRSREYQFRDRPGVAFSEGWLTLRSDHESADVVKGMLDRADHRGWTTIHVKGSPEFQRKVWVAATARGIKAVGYTPTASDRVDAENERQRLAREPEQTPALVGGTITRGMPPAPERTDPAAYSAVQRLEDSVPMPAPGSVLHPAQARTAANDAQAPTNESAIARPLRAYLAGLGEAPSNVEAVVALAAERLQSDRVYVGLVVARDYAPYEFKENAKESPYVTLQGPTGKQTVWGVDLPRALDAAGIRQGDSIALEFRGNQPVTVSVQDRNAAGGVIGEHDETVKRNTWFAAKLDDLRAQALQPAPAPSAAPALAPAPGSSAGPVAEPIPAPKTIDGQQAQPVAQTNAAAPVEPKPMAPAALKPLSPSSPTDATTKEASPPVVLRASDPAQGGSAKPAFAVKDADAPALVAFEAAMKQKNVPESLRQDLRELFVKQLAQSQARGEQLSVKIFDPSAPREPTRTIVPPQQKQKRSEHKISR